MSKQPYKSCFVIMPFGKKIFPDGSQVDFDAIYEQLIVPVLETAKLIPQRADKLYSGGIIHKHMLDQILLSEFVLADVTIDNPNVYWELGVRHALHPSRTLLVRGVNAQQAAMPFDIAFLQYTPYQLGTDGRVTSLNFERQRLRKAIRQAQKACNIDSPLYSLVQGIKSVPIDRLKTDELLRRFVTAADGLNGELARVLREKDKQVARLCLQKICKIHAPIAALDAFSQVALFLAHRETALWQEMTKLYDVMDPYLQATLLVREQYAMALNRCGAPDSLESRKAEEILRECINKHGPSSETNGILGRIYKDRYVFHRDRNQGGAAREALNQAIKVYTEGFMADSRDAYPGINAATLRELAGTPVTPESKDMLAAVKWAARQRVNQPEADYWDYATLVEAAVLDRDWETANYYLELAMVRAHVMPWMRETTANNLHQLVFVRSERGEDVLALQALIDLLESHREQEAALIT